MENLKRIITWPLGILSSLVIISFSVAGIYMLTPYIKESYKYNHQREYALRHLDEKSVNPSENPFMKHYSEAGRTTYEDMDRDGDYETFINWKNSNKTSTKILIKKTEPDISGKIDFYFPTISEKALNPLEICRNPIGHKVDYFLNKDDKIDSFIQLGPEKNQQLFKIELVDKKYKISN